jgi:two-component system chemotaxis response regulator CheY
METGFATSTRVLIVDDSATFRKMLYKILENQGFTSLHEASNGEEAWEKVCHDDQPYGLVLCDIHMPKINGLEFLKKLRSDDRFKNLPLILVTSESDKKMMAEGVLAGASHYLTKPITEENLFQRMVYVAKKTAKT